MLVILEFFQQLDSVALIAVLLLIFIGQAIVVFFPKDAFMVYIGFLFGTFGGGILNLIGLVGSSWLGYELGSSGLFDKLTKKDGFVRYQTWIKNHGLKALFISRLVPIMQYNVISLTTGISRLKRMETLFINFIAAIPYAFLFAYLGSNGINYVLENL